MGGSRGSAVASDNTIYFSRALQAAHYQDMTSILQSSLLTPGTGPVQTLAGDREVPPGKARSSVPSVVIGEQ